MGKINIKDIVEDARDHKWELISDTYQNLNSELVWECSEGHRVYASYKKIRNKYECPICKNNQYKNINTTPIKKDKNKKRILALDQATYITGYSIFDNQNLITYGTFETQLENDVARDHEVKNWLLSMIENWHPDIIGIEGIQYQKEKGVTTFEKLARLQGILLELCYSLNINYQICPTNTWRHHCGVKGRTKIDKKRSCQFLVKEWYDISVSDDISDAIGIGKYISETIAPIPEIIEWE